MASSSRSGEPAELRLWLLGGFRAALAGRPVPATTWRTRKSRPLVALLALVPGHRLHRDELLDHLWPDLDRALAAAKGRKALHFAGGAAPC